MSGCIAQKLTAMMNTRKCKLVNRQATTAEDIFYGLDDCVKDSDNDKEFQEIITSCTGTGEPEADQKAEKKGKKNRKKK